MVQIDRSVVLNSLPDAVIAADAQDQIVYINPAAETLLGWSSSELVGRPLTVVMSGAPTQSALELRANVQSGAPPRRLRASAVHKNGFNVDVEVSLCAANVSGGELFIACLRLPEPRIETPTDVQQQLAAHHGVMDALAQARTLREAAVGVLGAAGKALDWDLAALWTVDAENNVLRTAATWQSEALTAKGFAQRMSTLALRPGEGLPGQAWKCTQLVVSAKPPSDSPTDDSEPVPGPRAVCFPVFACGEVVGVLEFFSREPRAHSQGSLASAKMMAGSIGHFVERLHMEETRARLYHEAREGIRARDELLSVASHELKTPLCGLALRLQTLTLQTKRAASQAISAPELMSKLEAANRLAQRVLRLMDDLMQVTRFTNDRVNVDLENVDLSALVKDVTDRLRDQLASDGCSLDLKIASEVSGKWDPLQLEQVVTNLVSNAMKYGRGKPIEITLDSDHSSATLSIKDYGIGISQEDQARIFERFERAVSGGHYGGLGLGLWIVRQIVETMGGTIRVHSEPGRGSQFVVSVPLAPRQRLGNVAPYAKPQVVNATKTA